MGDLASYKQQYWLGGWSLSSGGLPSGWVLLVTPKPVKIRMNFLLIRSCMVGGAEGEVFHILLSINIVLFMLTLTCNMNLNACILVLSSNDEFATNALGGWPFALTLRAPSLGGGGWRRVLYASFFTANYFFKRVNSWEHFKRNHTLAISQVTLASSNRAKQLAIIILIIIQNWLWCHTQMEAMCGLLDIHLVSFCHSHIWCPLSKLYYISGRGQ